MSIFSKESFEEFDFLKEVNPLVLVGVALLICGALFFVFQGLFSILISNDEFEISHNETVSSEDSSGNSSSESSSNSIHVHILGSVIVPGLYELPAESRVNDAVVAAGGLTSDANEKLINLARLLEDGEQLYVYSREESEQLVAGETGFGFEESRVQSGYSAGTSSQAKSSSSGLININTATQEQLESLPGIGSATAKKIIDFRTTNGRFTSPKDITKVSGVGEKKYEQIKDLVCV